MKALVFDDLHYAATAVESYDVFRRLREREVIPAHIEQMLEAIPAGDLAIQFDFSNEVVDPRGSCAIRPSPGAPQPNGASARFEPPR